MPTESDWKLRVFTAFMLDGLIEMLIDKGVLDREEVKAMLEELTKRYKRGKEIAQRSEDKIKEFKDGQRN
jgi:polyhydroxyalkanoate synthesis regulator phasin